jgi:integrase
VFVTEDPRAARQLLGEKEVFRELELRTTEECFGRARSSSTSCATSSGSTLIWQRLPIRSSSSSSMNISRLSVSAITHGPLFRSAAGRTGMLTDRPMHRVDAYQMVRRRTAEAGFEGKVGCHGFRATGITAYLENAQAMAAHESPRTTKLYDRRGDEMTLDEVERIRI